MGHQLSGWPTKQPLIKNPGSEVIRTPVPRQPLVSRARRFEINVLYSGLGQLIAEVPGAGAFHRTDSQKEDFDLLIKCGRVGKHAVVVGLRGRRHSKVRLSLTISTKDLPRLMPETA